MGGSLVAIELVAALSEADAVMPSWALDLAKVMSGSVLRVRLALPDHPVARIRVASAATVLALVRPTSVPQCRALSSICLGPELGPARWMDNGEALAQRTLLHLLLGQSERAAEAVRRLATRHDDAGLPLHDWVVARIHQHGSHRELGAFRHLKTSLKSAPPEHAAFMSLLGTATLARRLGMPVVESLALFEEGRVEGGALRRAG